MLITSFMISVCRGMWCRIGANSLVLGRSIFFFLMRSCYWWTNQSSFRPNLNKTSRLFRSFYYCRVNNTATMSATNWSLANVNSKSLWMIFGRRCGISKTPLLAKKKNWYCTLWCFHILNYSSSPAASSSSSFLSLCPLSSWRVVSSCLQKTAHSSKKLCLPTQTDTHRFPMDFNLFSLFLMWVSLLLLLLSFVSDTLTSAKQQQQQ